MMMMTTSPKCFLTFLIATLLTGVAAAQVPEPLDDVLPPDGEYGAVELEAVSRCVGPGQRETTFHWKAGPIPPLALRIDVTKYPSGLDRGRFETWPLEVGTLDLVLHNELEPGTNVKWRVLAESPQGWVTSLVGRCHVAVCPNDAANRSEEEGR